MESFNKKIKLTIIGSKSFIGKNLFLDLINKNYKINFISSRISYSKILDKRHIKQQLNNIGDGIVILCGWPIESDFHTTKVWSDHIFILLKEFILKSKTNYVLCIGSAAELDPSRNKALKEFDFTKGVGDYGMSKVYLLNKFLSDNQINPKQFCWIRLFAPTGKFESKKRLLPHITNMALNNENIVCNNPEIIRDFYDVKEATECICYIIEKKYSGIINLGSGKKISIKDLITKVTEITGSKSKLIIRKVKGKEWKSVSWYPDITKLKNLVPCYPKKDIEEIINLHINLTNK